MLLSHPHPTPCLSPGPVDSASEMPRTSVLSSPRPVVPFVQPLSISKLNWARASSLASLAFSLVLFDLFLKLQSKVILKNMNLITRYP